MSTFLVSGDVHGQFEDLKLAVMETCSNAGVAEKDLSAIFLVGDVEPIRTEEEMRMVHGPNKYRKMGDFVKVLSGEIRFETPVYFIGGNHEPWEALDADGGMINQRGNWGKGFHFLGRSGMVEIEGLKVSFLSAISSPEMRENPTEKIPDRRRDSKRNRTYWTRGEVEGLLHKRPDIFLSHEWPLGLGAGKDGNEAGSWQINRIIERSKPQLSFHGHMHHRANTKIGDTQVTGLDHIRGGVNATSIFTFDNMVASLG